MNYQRGPPSYPPPPRMPNPTTLYNQGNYPNWTLNLSHWGPPQNNYPESPIPRLPGHLDSSRPISPLLQFNQPQRLYTTGSPNYNEHANVPSFQQPSPLINPPENHILDSQIIMKHKSWQNYPDTDANKPTRIYTGFVSSMEGDLGFVDPDIFFHASKVKGHAMVKPGDYVLIEAVPSPASMKQMMPNVKWNCNSVQLVDMSIKLDNITVPFIEGKNEDNTTDQFGATTANDLITTPATDEIPLPSGPGPISATSSCRINEKDPQVLGQTEKLTNQKKNSAERKRKSGSREQSMNKPSQPGSHKVGSNFIMCTGSAHLNQSDSSGQPRRKSRKRTAVPLPNFQSHDEHSGATGDELITITVDNRNHSAPIENIETEKPAERSLENSNNHNSNDFETTVHSRSNVNLNSTNIEPLGQLVVVEPFEMEIESSNPNPLASPQTLDPDILPQIKIKEENDQEQNHVISQREVIPELHSVAGLIPIKIKQEKATTDEVAGLTTTPISETTMTTTNAFTPTSLVQPTMSTAMASVDSGVQATGGLNLNIIADSNSPSVHKSAEDQNANVPNDYEHKIPGGNSKAHEIPNEISNAAEKTPNQPDGHNGDKSSSSDLSTTLIISKERNEIKKSTQGILRPTPIRRVTTKPDGDESNPSTSRGKNITRANVTKRQHPPSPSPIRKQKTNENKYKTSGSDRKSPSTGRAKERSITEANFIEQESQIKKYRRDRQESRERSVEKAKENNLRKHSSDTSHSLTSSRIRQPLLPSPIGPPMRNNPRSDKLEESGLRNYNRERDFRMPKTNDVQVDRREFGMDHQYNTNSIYNRLGSLLPSNPWCDYHRSHTHNTDECRALRAALAKQGPCKYCGRNNHLSVDCFDWKRSPPPMSRSPRPKLRKSQ